MALTAPLDGKLTITSRFGKRSQVPGTKVSTTDHLGTDLRAAVGTPCHAPADGVMYAFRQSGRYSGPRIFTAPLAGNWLMTWHPTLGVYITYAHLQATDVALGQSVKAGQQVGRTGNSGGVAPHIHVGVWTRIGNTWTAHDPEQFFNFTGKAEAPAAPEPEGFLMALNDDEQAEVLRLLRENADNMRKVDLWVESVRGDQLYDGATKSRAERIHTLVEGMSAKVDTTADKVGALDAAILGLGNGKYSWLDRIRSVMNALEAKFLK